LATAAGADVLVAGSSIFGEAAGVTAAIERLRASILSSIRHVVPGLLHEHAFKDSVEA